MNKYSFIFVGQIIPQELLNEHFEELKKFVDIAGNTFYTTLLEGLVENGCHISNVSRINLKNIDNKKIYKYNGVNYKFCKYIKMNIFRFLFSLFSGFFQIIKFKINERHNDEKRYAIFNVLRISLSLGAILSCKLLKIPMIGIVTDVPGYRVKRGKRSPTIFFADRIGKIILGSFDMYILLSEQMKNIIKIKNKPYAIIEGAYDSSKEKSVRCKIDFRSNNTFKIMYAGSLHYRYGIMNLIKAVQSLNYSDIELNIYGSGEAEEEIKEIAEKDNRIIFKGLVPRDYLLKCEKEASLLVNPRPIEDEYVKYSFPSKNMEYMASGTPTLITNIPSLPDDYKKYVILSETNKVTDLSDNIEYIYKNHMKFDNLGIKAREYILREKTKEKQSLKLINMIEYYEKQYIKFKK